MTLVEVKTAKLEGMALDWAVAKVEGWEQLDMPLAQVWMRHSRKDARNYPIDKPLYNLTYSTDWGQCGPLIEKHGIEVFCNLSAEQASRFKNASPDWRACMNRGRSEHSYGPTALIAAMRCFVAAKLGDTVQVPEELLP